MGSSREGWDLFHPLGRHCFSEALRGKRRFQWHHLWTDTIGRHFICPVIGHSKKTFDTDDNPPEIICYRCVRKI